MAGNATGTLKRGVSRTVIMLMMILGASPSPSRSEAPPPVGDELIVNQVTTGRQLNSALAALGQGDLVVVWEGEDADGRGVFGRVVDPLAQPVGDAFQVSVTTAGNQASAEVAAGSDGSFIVVWENDLPAQTSISGRYYDAAGVPGPELTIAQDEAGVDAKDPMISRLSDGSFIVIWDEYVSATQNGSVRARFLDATGSAIGASFILATDGTSDSVFGPEMAARAGGGVIVTWDYEDAPDGRWAQMFTDAASPDGVPLEITPDSSGFMRLAGLRDGGFMAVWRDGLSRAMRRRFDAAGLASPPVAISDASGLHRWTDVVGLPSGQAALTWTTLPSSGPDQIDAQLIAADGSVAREWLVDTSPVSLFGSRIVYDEASDHVVVAWTRRGSVGGDQEDIILRRFDLGVVLFADGFESGDFSAWTSVLP